ncbi:c-type cytochrome [Filimonas effusa]|uniref:c-type cytochrome n=1 Tax=Filimonas effusa TaxID=2508721 RepID=UPI0013E989BD|nr:c-type cytochrome [Filimonas effusa]
MKRYLIVTALAALTAACGSSEEAKSPASEKKETKPAVDLSTNPDYQKGVKLVAGSDCLSCHSIKATLIGPSYNKIADKYESTPENVTTLATRIVKGSQGIWGQVPMTPHPVVTQADAEQMVKYILLLKTQQ